MEAWSHAPLGNDDALDFIDDLWGDPRWDRARTLFSQALEAEYLEVPDASAVVAALAVLAAANAGRDFDEEYPDLLKKLGAPPQDLRQLALSALSRVGTDSELDSLWSDSEEYAAWRATLACLENELI
jgi:hypothetical protein